MIFRAYFDCMNYIQMQSKLLIIIIKNENLLPLGLLSRLHASYPQHSGLLDKEAHMFHEAMKERLSC